MRVGIPTVPIPIFTYKYFPDLSKYKPPQVSYLQTDGDNPNSDICMAWVCPDNVSEMFALSLLAISDVQ